MTHRFPTGGDALYPNYTSVPWFDVPGTVARDHIRGRERIPTVEGEERKQSADATVSKGSRAAASALPPGRLCRDRASSAPAV